MSSTREQQTNTQAVSPPLIGFGMFSPTLPYEMMWIRTIKGRELAIILPAAAAVPFFTCNCCFRAGYLLKGIREKLAIILLTIWIFYDYFFCRKMRQGSRGDGRAGPRPKIARLAERNRPGKWYNIVPPGR